MDRRNDTPKRIKQVGLLTGIPMVQLVGPGLGYYLGNALDQRWSFAPWGMVLGIALGFGASIKLIVQMIRQSDELDRTTKQ